MVSLILQKGNSSTRRLSVTQVSCTSKWRSRAGGMAQQIKGITAKPHHLTLIPRTHVVKEKNPLLKIVI